MADSKSGGPKQTQASAQDAREAAAKGVGSQAGLKEGESVMAPAVQSTTTRTPAEADNSSLPNAMDAKTDDPPVRSGKPDVAIAQTLAAGAGEHQPPDSDVYGPDGRMLRPAETLQGR